MVATPKARGADKHKLANRFGEVLLEPEPVWEVDVTDIDALLWMSPQEVEDLRENQCMSVAVSLGPSGVAGFGVRRLLTGADFVDDEVSVEKFNRAPDGSKYHAESAGALCLGDIVKFVNGKFVTGIRHFVKLMRLEAMVARQKAPARTHVVVLGIQRTVVPQTPTPLELSMAVQHDADVAAAWQQLRRERPHLPEAPPTPCASPRRARSPCHSRRASRGARRRRKSHQQKKSFRISNSSASSTISKPDIVAPEGDIIALVMER